MRLVMTLFYLLLILVGVSFAVLNASPVEVNLYFMKLTMPISILITIMFGLGLFLGFLIFLYRYWRLKAICSRLKNQLKLTEKEIQNLRTIPLKDH